MSARSIKRYSLESLIALWFDIGVRSKFSFEDVPDLSPLNREDRLLFLFSDRVCRGLYGVGRHRALGKDHPFCSKHDPFALLGDRRG